MAAGHTVGQHAAVPGGRVTTTAVWAGTTTVAIARGFIPGVPVTDAIVAGIVVVGTASAGMLLVARRRSRWCSHLLLLAAALATGGIATVSYAQAAVEPGREWPLEVTAAWLGSWLAIPGFACLGFLLLLYPTGRLPSPRWRPLAMGGVAAAGGLTASAALRPGPLAATTSITNPVGVEADGLLAAIETASSLGIGVLVVGATTSLVVRFRRSEPLQREQLRWLLRATVVAGVTIAFAGVASGVLNELSFYLGAVGLLLIPVAIAVGVLGDDVIDLEDGAERSLVYLALTIGVVAIYALVAAGVATVVDPEVPVEVPLAAGAVVAVALLPLRGLLQQGVNRAMYGDRADPYAALAGLSRELAAARPVAEVLPSVPETVARSLRLAFAELAVRRADDLDPIARYGRPAAGTTHAIELLHQGELVGRLTVGAAPGDALKRRDLALLDDLSVAIAALVHGSRLTQDLDRSRAALVTSRLDEQRRLRRDLHDGLGPELAGVTFGLGAVRNLLRADPDAADELLARLQGQTRSAVGQVRDLVEGLAPPELEQAGLLGAVEAGASRIGFGSVLGCSVHIEADDDLALPPVIELATYRIAMEALANVARHAAAASAVVRLTVEDEVRLVVEDDGVGMPVGFVAGVGITSMRERAAEVGGRLAIGARPGGGTTVRCTLPCWDGLDG
jgi:signal transduction histidine kinase